MVDRSRWTNCTCPLEFGLPFCSARSTHKAKWAMGFWYSTSWALFRMVLIMWWGTQCVSLWLYVFRLLGVRNTVGTWRSRWRWHQKRFYCLEFIDTLSLSGFLVTTGNMAILSSPNLFPCQSLPCRIHCLTRSLFIFQTHSQSLLDAHPQRHLTESHWNIFITWFICSFNNDCTPATFCIFRDITQNGKWTLTSKDPLVCLMYMLYLSRTFTGCPVWWQTLFIFIYFYQYMFLVHHVYIPCVQLVHVHNTS